MTAAWPHAKPPNALGYAASLAAVLEAYPLGLVRECCDPRTGLAREREFPPTPASIIEWCDKRLKFHRGAVKWGELKAKEAAARGQFTEEHERGMLKRLQDLMRGLFQQSQAQAAE